jgi:uncharacterized protein
MGRIIFWLLAAAAAFMGFRRWQAKQQQALKRDRNESPRVEMMVRCSVCGLNVPQSEALSLDSRWFCGEEHRRRATSAREA